MFDLMKLSVATALRSRRSLALKIRRDIRTFVRYYKEHLPLDEKEVFKAEKSGIVEDVEKSLEKWTKDWKKTEHALSDGEKKTLGEENKFFSELTAETRRLEKVEKILNANKAQLGSDLYEKIAKVHKRLKGVDDELINSLKKQMIGLKSEINDEQHFANLLLTINDIQKASDKAWDLNSDIRGVEKDIDKMNDELKEELKILNTPDPNTHKYNESQITHLKKSEDKLIEFFEKLLTLVDIVIKDLNTLMNFFIELYFKFEDKEKKKIVAFEHTLAQKGFPEEHLKTIKDEIQKAIIDEKADLNAIRNIIARLRHYGNISE